jgi:hypothetical protein
MLPAILSFLEYMIESSDGQVLTETDGLYNSIVNIMIYFFIDIIKL